jgi:uncharacterized membrane protein (Fun14 family)
MFIVVALIGILFISLLAGANLIVAQYNADELNNMGIESK